MTFSLFTILAVAYILGILTGILFVRFDLRVQKMEAYKIGVMDGTKFVKELLLSDKYKDELEKLKAGEGCYKDL